MAMVGQAVKCANPSCGREVSEATSLEVGKDRYCSECFIAKAQAIRTGSLTPAQREAIKREIREEMAGLLPRDTLKALVEEGYGRLVQGADFDEEVNRLVNDVERISSLAMLKEMLHMMEETGRQFERMQDDVRDRMRKVGQL